MNECQRTDWIGNREYSRLTGRGNCEREDSCFVDSIAGEFTTERVYPMNTIRYVALCVSGAAILLFTQYPLAATMLAHAVP